MFILLYIGVIVVFFAILLLLTFGRSGWGYLSIDAVTANLNNNFLIGVYIFFPAVTVFLLTLATQNSSFAQYNWLVAVGIAVARLIIIVSASRWYMIKKIAWTVVTVLSIIASYIVCWAVVHSSSNELLTMPNIIVITMLFVSVLIVANLLSNAYFGNLDEATAYTKNVVRLYTKYRTMFDAVVKTVYKKDQRRYLILFSIMIAEDTNRPGIVRMIERMIFPFGKIATTGIMQVTAKDYLSNQKSVEVAQEIISGSYTRHKKKHSDDDYLLIRAVASDYNDGVYPELIVDIYYILKDYEFKHRSTTKLAK